jgi:hypothetical protein
MVGCPLSCTFCPQDQLKAGYGKDRYLSLDRFKRILDKIPGYVRIDFSGMSEPWANPHCTAMLRYAVEQRKHSVAVYTTLYGMDDYDAVLGIFRDNPKHIEVLCLHLPDANGNMRGFRWSRMFEDALVAFLKFKAEEILPVFTLMCMDPHGHVHADVRRIIDNVGDWIGNDRAGVLNKEGIAGQPIEAPLEITTPVACSYTPFYDHNVLLPNGDVVLCCMDYSRKHKIGNLVEGDYWSLFSSKGMNDLRNGNMRFDGATICKNCTRALRYDLSPNLRQTWQLPPEPEPT